MDTAKIYIDSDGNECSITTMVSREPQWAAERVQEGEKAIEELAKLKQSNDIPVQSGDLLSADCVIASITKALDMVSALCKPRGSKDSREWIMSIPAQPEHDPDLVIANALRRAKQYIKRAT